jgi:glutaredoxin
MDYLLFTYPNCDKCDAFKGYLKETPLRGEELSLVQKEGKLRVREFLGRIKRDDKGAIVLPVFVLRENEQIVGIFNDQRELESWLKSRA